MTRSRVLLAAALLAGCLARSAAADMRDERLSATYRAAMADYTAGRLDAAVSGFEKAVRADGENASARFQLACLLQDHRRDWLGAVCQYREYLRLEPGSDKAPLARERADLCERELAKALAEKHGLVGGEALAAEAARARAELAEARRALAKAEMDLADATARQGALTRENARLRRMVKGVAADLEEDDDATLRAAPARLAEARALLDDEAEDAVAAPRDVSRPDLPDDDAGAPDGATGRGLADAKALLEEEDADAARSDLLDPNAPPAASRLTDLGRARTEEKGRKGDEPPHEARPETYVVQEGDTLYKIALRFYGRTSDWKRIRDANKAIITTDGRVQSGQTIVLP